MGLLARIFKPVGAFLHNLLPPNFPKRKLFPCILMLLTEAVCQTSLTSFVGFLMVDMHVVEGQEDSGTWAGWLVSAFSIAQFLSSFVIGAVSDALGRRPVLLVGSFGIFISNVLFGFSFNYWFILGMRLLNGLLNGNIGVIKTYLGEISNSTNRVQVFSYIGLTWCVGSVFGAFLGGVLYDPCSKYPSLFGSLGLFNTFPGLLPQLVVSSFSLIALVLGYFFILENDVVQRDATDHTSKCKQILTSIRLVFHSMYSFFNRKSLWCVYVIVCYTFLGFCHTAFQTIFPLLMISNVGNGGFGFSTAEVGYFSAISSVAGFIMLVFFYKHIVRFLGLCTTFSFAVFANAMSYSMFPSLEGLNGQPGWARWLCFASFAFLWNFFSQSSFSSIQTLIVNTVEVSMMGSANGVSQSFVAMGRIIGTITIPSLLTWCFGNDLGFPLNQYFPFLCLGAAAALVTLLSLFIPRATNFPKEEVCASPSQPSASPRFTPLPEPVDSEAELTTTLLDPDLEIELGDGPIDLN